MDTEGLIILAMVLAILGGLLLEVKLNRILGPTKKYKRNAGVDP